jgi:hypothetical protein
MDTNFDALRAAIYGTLDERKRSVSLVVNSVMATDIWTRISRYFATAAGPRPFLMMQRQQESEVDAVDRKATIVIEHLIQA